MLSNIILSSKDAELLFGDSECFAQVISQHSLIDQTHISFISFKYQCEHGHIGLSDVNEMLDVLAVVG